MDAFAFKRLQYVETVPLEYLTVNHSNLLSSYNGVYTAGGDTLQRTVLAYLAGAIDSDGCITIKRSTYHIRVRKDASNAVYSERVMLKQVTPEIPTLLHESFGGSLRMEKKQGNSKSLWSWSATDLKAATAIRLMLPFLRVKRRQADLLLELRESKGSRYWQESYWFEKQYPDWTSLPMLTTSEVAKLLNMTHHGSIGQAVSNGTILALPYAYDSSKGEQPRFPRLLIERLAENRGSDGLRNRRPPALIAWRERIWSDVRELNKIGIKGTSTYFLTGVHAPALV